MWLRPIEAHAGGMDTTTADERDLAGRFRAGDADAVREVYRRYAGRLAAVARSMLADAAVIDDVVQQTLLQAWRASATLDADRCLSAWLYAICRRVCIDEYRRSTRVPTPGASAGTLDGVVDGPSLERAWTAWEVRRAIDELPADERTIVRLASLDGWSLPEIASHLGVALGTVKSRSFRAHRRLAVALAHLRHDDLLAVSSR
jgi:RNA polymerase sigma-70 factor (ECF subfamily)